MPLLLSPTDDAESSARIWRLEGLPDFNTEEDFTFAISRFDGFFDVPAPRAVLAAAGGGPGAVPSGDWLPAEAPYLVVGRIVGDKAFLMGVRRLLLAALPTDREAPVVALGSGWDVDLQIFVRRYDRGEIVLRRNLEFSIPLVAPDPYKYALEPLAGALGVFTSEDWFQSYTLSGSNWVETYALSGSRWVDTYQQAAPSGIYPESLLLESPGDATSKRVTFTITGPLDAGDWWLLNETTGDRMWVEVGVSESQQLVIDSHAGTAVLSGADATHLVYGDFLSLVPGANLYRLQAGSASAAFAAVEALPAYL